MTKRLNQGDKVAWNTSQGATTGTIEKKLIRPTDTKGHHLAASQTIRNMLLKATGAAIWPPTNRTR